MRIAFVSQPGCSVLPPVGSLEIWTREVARRLADRHEVAVYASAGPQTADGVRDGIEYRFVQHGGDRRAARLLRPLWRLRPADRALFSSPLHPLLYWLRVARDLRRRQVDVVHVFNYSQALPIVRRLNPGATIALHMQCEWLVQIDRATVARRLRHADVVVGCSEHIADAVRRRFPEHAWRCRTVYNGVDVPGTAAPGSDDGTVTLLHVGRISPEKGHHVLLDALEEVVREHPELRVVLVGEESPIPREMAVAISPDPVVRALERFYGGSYLAGLRAGMSPELAERVTFAGRVDHARTAEHYAAADLFAFPSLLEAFAIPPVEAMAAGLPVVASRTGGIVETVVDGRTGLLVERDDARALAGTIAELVADRDRRLELGAAGRARARELFCWDAVTDDLERTLSHPPTLAADNGAVTAGPRPRTASASAPERSRG